MEPEESVAKAQDRGTPFLLVPQISPLLLLEVLLKDEKLITVSVLRGIEEEKTGSGFDRSRREGVSRGFKEEYNDDAMRWGREATIEDGLLVAFLGVR